MHAKSLQSCLTLCNSMDCHPPGFLSMGFSRQEHWSGFPCPPPGNLHDPGIKTGSLRFPTLAGEFFTTSTTWEVHYCCSVAHSCPSLCDPMDCRTPGFPVYYQLPELSQTHVHWVGYAIQPSHLCCSLLLLPSIFPSIRIFSNESVLLIRWPKYYSFSFISVIPMNIQDWFPLGWTDLISLLSKGLSYKPIYTHIYDFIGI